MWVRHYTEDILTDISQTSDPNRCECDTSMSPDTPTNTLERLVYRLLPLKGSSVWRRSVKAADRCRQSDPVSRFTVQLSRRLAVRFLFNFLFVDAIRKKKHCFIQRIQQLSPIVQTNDVTDIVFLFLFFPALLSPDKNKVQRRSSETLFNQTLVNFSTPPHSVHAASRVLTVCN